MLDDLFFHTRGTRYWQCSSKSGGVGACVPSATGPEGSSTAAGGALSVEGCFRDFCGIGRLEVVSILEVVFLALGDANGSLGGWAWVHIFNGSFGNRVVMPRTDSRGVLPEHPVKNFTVGSSERVADFGEFAEGDPRILSGSGVVIMENAAH